MRRRHIRDIKARKVIVAGFFRASFSCTRDAARDVECYTRSSLDEMAASCIDLFHHALEQSLNQLGKTGLKLKEGQYEALKSVVVEGKDTICVLPTGYGKSLIYQILPYVFDFFSGDDNHLLLWYPR